MEKVKATVYLTKDTWERAKALTNDVPGFSVSKMLDGMLQQAVPQLERTLQLAKDGDLEAMVQFMDTFSATLLADFGSEFSVVRKELLEKAGKEKET